jgi:hypothetical protein
MKFLRQVGLVCVICLLLLGNNSICFSQQKSDWKCPVVHRFHIWGTLDTPDEKIKLYWGFTNGYFDQRGEQSFPLMNCLSSKISPDQVVAMIDKYYKRVLNAGTNHWLTGYLQP